MVIFNRVPAHPLNQLQREVNELFGGVFGDGRFAPTSGANPPPMNVWEEGSNYFVETELPGFTMNDIEVTVQGDELSIKGERTIEQSKGATYLRSERRSGSFARTWSFPVELDAEQVKASLKDGVLLVTLPKSAKSQPRKIAVKPAGE